MSMNFLQTEVSTNGKQGMAFQTEGKGILKRQMLPQSLGYELPATKQ